MKFLNFFLLLSLAWISAVHSTYRCYDIQLNEIDFDVEVCVFLPSDFDSSPNVSLSPPPSTATDDLLSTPPLEYRIPSQSEAEILEDECVALIESNEFANETIGDNFDIEIFAAQAFNKANPISADAILMDLMEDDLEAFITTEETSDSEMFVPIEESPVACEPLSFFNETMFELDIEDLTPALLNVEHDTMELSNIDNSDEISYADDDVEYYHVVTDVAEEEQVESVSEALESVQTPREIRKYRVKLMLRCTLALALLVFFANITIFCVILYVLIQQFLAEMLEAEAVENFCELLEKIHAEQQLKEKVLALPAPPVLKMIQDKETVMDQHEAYNFPAIEIDACSSETSVTMEDISQSVA